MVFRSPDAAIGPRPGDSDSGDPVGSTGPEVHSAANRTGTDLQSLPEADARSRTGLSTGAPSRPCTGARTRTRLLGPTGPTGPHRALITGMDRKAPA